MLMFHMIETGQRYRIIYVVLYDIVSYNFGAYDNIRSCFKPCYNILD